MSSRAESRLWHPFADMGAVAGNELVISRGEDVWVWDEDGTRYLDATASLWYANIGHGRPEIAQAVAAQMERIEAYSAFGDLATRPPLELAERLSAHAPMADAKIFLTNGGGDAIETAAKLSRRYWQAVGKPERELLISRSSSYHGIHGYGTALAGIPANREALGPLVPGTIQVPYDSAEALRSEIEGQGAERVAAFFMEPVVGVGGVLPPPEGYVEEVGRICAETGVLLVVDSVICGFGRLGTWYGIERWPSVKPDMIAFAKGVTSGYLPLGGLVVGGHVAEPFYQRGGPSFRHGVTYAGHASACAAALANLEILEGEGLMSRGRELEGELLGALAPLAEHPLVGEVRGGVGMMAALDLAPEVLAADPGAVGKLMLAARQAGVLVRALGRGVAVSPPLTATPEHFGLIAQGLGRALEALPAPGREAAAGAAAR